MIKVYKKIISWVRFFWGILLINLGYFFYRLSGVKGTPSELEHLKGKHVSIFIFNFNLKEGRRNCLEIARGRIGARGDIYIIPAPQSGQQDPMHESFHNPKNEKPSEYHIVEKGSKTKEENLLSGDKDFTNAFRFSTFMRIPSCFCFRCGQSLKEENVRGIVEKLMRYVCVASSDKEKIVSLLTTEGKCQFRPPSEYIKAKKDLLKHL